MDRAHPFWGVHPHKIRPCYAGIALLQSISRHAPAAVTVTITTADQALCRKLEPNVCPTSRRFAAMQALSRHGVSCGVLLMPTLPYINDTDETLTSLVERSAQAGAKWVYAGDAFAVSLRSN